MLAKVQQSPMYTDAPMDLHIGSEALATQTITTETVSQLATAEIIQKIRTAVSELPSHANEIIYTAMIFFAERCPDATFRNEFQQFSLALGRINDEGTACPE